MKYLHVTIMFLIILIYCFDSLVGYKMKVNSSSISGANKAVIKEAVQKKKEEYQSDLELVRINDIYEANKV